MLIFERSQPARINLAQRPLTSKQKPTIPAQFLRTEAPRLPMCSELDVVRHYTRLSQKNFSIDTHFYPLGSCTMKYNPRGVHRAASIPALLNRHPLSPAENSQGTLYAFYHLQSLLAEITGMKGVCLSPMAGSQAN